MFVNPPQGLAAKVAATKSSEAMGLLVLFFSKLQNGSSAPTYSHLKLLGLQKFPGLLGPLNSQVFLGP